MREYGKEINFTCDIYGREVFENERICAVCSKKLPFNDGAICPFCGRATGEAGACLECKQKPLAVKRARSAFIHEGEAAHLVLRLKRGERFLAFTLAGYLRPIVEREFSDCDLLVGVPMSARSERKRGYNQSYLLGEELSRLTAIPFAVVAEKTRETEQQKSLGRSAREENLKGCFLVKNREAVKGKRLLVVDDAMTTGSTVSELAHVLYRAGALQVDCVTVTGVPQKMRSSSFKEGKGGVQSK